jgi:hypothetical protein
MTGSRTPDAQSQQQQTQHPKTQHPQTQHPKTQHPQVNRPPLDAILARETQLFGDRPLPMISSIKPHTSEPRRNESERMQQTFERMVTERYPEPHGPASNSLNPKAQQTNTHQASSIESTKVDKMDMDEVQRLMKSLEHERDAIFASVDNKDTFVNNNNSALHDSPAEHQEAIFSPPADAAIIFRKQLEEEDLMRAAAKPGNNLPIISSEALDLRQVAAAAAVQVPPSSRRLVQRFVSINSFDRHWIHDPFRYAYTVWFSGFGQSDGQHRYKSVRELAVTRLVIPMEVNEKPSLSLTTLAMSNTSAHNDNAFNHAYLMVCIDGFDDVYDGTNDRVRRAFCMMVFDKAYRAPNGRGYIVMQPAQAERKLFYPAPLSDLRNLKISIVKPNGAIVSNSTDDYGVSKFEHEDYNPTHLRVVLDKYFDKKEFFVGDTVLFRDYKAHTHADCCGIVPVDPGSVQMLNEFINRAEGHEIAELGQPNENGFFRTFHIMAPGHLDKVAGKLVVNTRVIDALLAFNEQQETHADPNLYDQRRNNGGVCNMSLQNSMTLTLTHEVADGPVADDERLPPY